jgi:mercuric reductase
MEDYLRAEGVETVTRATPLELLAEAPMKRLKVHVPDGDRIFEAEAILMAVGRTPNTDGLGLTAIGVKLDAQGFIEVDEHLQTSVPGIYAAGDVTTHPKLVYLAAKSGSIAAANALGLLENGAPRSLDIRVLPEVVFTDPQVATVGLTEAEANSMGHEIQVTRLPLEHVPRALAARDTRGFIKLVVDRKTDRLLGAHMVGAEAGEVIQTAALAIQMGYAHGFKVSQLRDMFFPYLVQVEGLKLAAQTLTKDVKALSCCAG